MLYLDPYRYLCNETNPQRWMQENREALEAVLGMEAAFLVDQLPTAGQLENLVGNLLRLLPLLEPQQLVLPLLQLVCSPELLPVLSHRQSGHELQK
jgi:hypothetical protein